MKSTDESLRNSETAMKEMLLDIVRLQRSRFNKIIRVYILTISCMGLIILSLVFGFLWYASQQKSTKDIITDKTTQTMSGEKSEIDITAISHEADSTQ